MKLIGRTLIILAAALVVVGATFGLQRAGLLGSGGPGGEFRERQRAGQTAAGAQQDTQAQRGQFPEGFEGRGPGGREGGPGGFFAVAELGKNLVIIGVIVAVVAGVQSFIRRRWPKKGARLTESRL